MRRSYGLSVVVVLLALSSQATAAVVISDGGTNATANAVSQDSSSTTGASLTAVSGATSATTSSSFGNTGLFASYNQTSNGGHAGGYAYANFTLTTNMSYTVSGVYNNPGGGSVQFYTNLLDYTIDPSNGYPVYTYFKSGNNTSMILDNSPPNAQGSTTGMLTAGHLYYWDSSADLYSGSAGVAGANLSLSSLAAVPEAQSLVVWSVLAVVMCAIGWYRRSATTGVA